MKQAEIPSEGVWNKEDFKDYHPSRDEQTGIKCQGCNKMTGTEQLHSCPYASDIGNDDSEHCNCCPDCTHECAMDI